jgi:hypothetical protein
MVEAISRRQIAGTFLAHPSLTPRERARLIEAGLPASSLEHPIPILAGWIVAVGPTSFTDLDERWSDAGYSHLVQRRLPEPEVRGRFVGGELLARGHIAGINPIQLLSPPDGRRATALPGY